MLRRTKLEVEKELPSKTAVVIKCGQSAWQSFIYSQISDQVGMSPIESICDLHLSPMVTPMVKCLPSFVGFLQIL